MASTSSSLTLSRDDGILCMHGGLSPDPELPSQSRACESMGFEGVFVQLVLLSNRSWVVLGEGVGVEVHLVAGAEALVFLIYLL